MQWQFLQISIYKSKKYKNNLVIDSRKLIIQLSEHETNI